MSRLLDSLVLWWASPPGWTVYVWMADSQCFDVSSLKTFEVAEGWKQWLQWALCKQKHSKMKILVSGPIVSWQIDGETMETVTDLIF